MNRKPLIQDKLPRLIRGFLCAIVFPVKNILAASKAAYKAAGCNSRLYQQHVILLVKNLAALRLRIAFLAMFSGIPKSRYQDRPIELRCYNITRFRNPFKINDLRLGSTRHFLAQNRMFCPCRMHPGFIWDFF